MSEYHGFDDDGGGMAPAAAVPVNASDKDIEQSFETGRLRVVQEKNDIFLLHIMQFISNDKNALWGNLRPEYQRRLRWDNKKKSRLIESFIMNVPVPPVFLYEKELGRFEVMDGQQRLNAIAEFFSGSFALEGLTIWPALNKRTFSNLPPLVKRGLERAKISAITLMSDNSSVAEDSLDLRAQVFDRLNTGGQPLNAQELRNSLYSGSFNKLLIELAREPVFTEAWDIPAYKDNTRSDGTPSNALLSNTLFQRMADVEIVLRFFAFRDPKLIAGAVRNMLDKTMIRYRHADESKIEQLRQEFMKTLALSRQVFGGSAFRLPPSEGRAGKLSRPLYDAEMIAMFRLGGRRDEILACRDRISTQIQAMASPDSPQYDTLVGRGNTSTDTKKRLNLVEAAVREIIDG